MNKTSYFTLILLVTLLPTPVLATWFADTETGAAFSGINDVRIPGDTGSEFSFNDDLKIDPAWFVRLRLGKTFASRHTISLLAAPLLFRSKGKFDRDIDFAGETFDRGEFVRGTYRFDSYRITYRYDFFLEPLELGAGVTLKIRDAAIALDGTKYAASTNTGFVPLINFRLYRAFTDRWGFLLEGDALAAPQGRAEDVNAAMTVDLSDHVRLRLGYRILEGGADNDEVYTFSLIHYASVGLTATF